MATVYYKVVDLQQYLSDVETQLNTLGNDGWELSSIFNENAILISGSSGITISGSVALPSGVVSSSAQVKAYLPSGTVSSSTQATSWTVLSSSYATTASHLPTAYGEWYSVLRQSGSQDTAYSIIFNSESLSRQFNLSDNTKITAQRAGIYKFSLWTNTRTVGDGGAHNLNIWIRKNGTDVDWSNKTFYLTSIQYGTLSGSVFAQYDICTELTSGSYVEFIWNAKMTQTSINAGHTGTFEFFPITGSLSNPVRPNIPSVIANVVQIG